MTRQRTPYPPRFPGYSGVVNTAHDFALCGPERRFAILSSLTRLMDRYSADLRRADERLAEAAKAVEREQAEIDNDRAFLADLMAVYIEFSQVFACEAATAIEATSDSGGGEMAQ